MQPFSQRISMDLDTLRRALLRALSKTVSRRRHRKVFATLYQRALWHSGEGGGGGSCERVVLWLVSYISGEAPLNVERVRNGKRGWAVNQITEHRGTARRHRRLHAGGTRS